jgi:(p)ppGpp synthase/HD superfamily hydrolase
MLGEAMKPLQHYYAEQINRARRFAERAHAGQLRKYTNEPYIVHPAAVAEMVQAVTPLREYPTIQAAWLHDVVEDCGVSLQEIVETFGAQTAELVYWLTDKSRPEDGNRAVRKWIDREHIAHAPAAAQTVKLADLVHNTETIVRYDPGFARIYLKEKELLLPRLHRGHPSLLNLAHVTLRQAQRQLVQAALAAKEQAEARP